MNRRFQHTQHLWHTYPNLTAMALIAVNVTASADVTSMVDHHLADAKNLVSGVPESELPAIRAWRRVYTQMGLKPTQYRCAAESLLRRLRTHGDLPSLHPLVDLCNAVSAAHAIPIAALDLDRIHGNLTVRPAAGTESYVTFADEIEHPVHGEIIYADDAGYAHSRRWVTRQSGRSAINPHTTRALIVAEAVHDTAETDLTRLFATLTDTIATTWGTTPVAKQLSVTEPHIDLDIR